MSSPAAPRVVSYARISEDVSGEAPGVRRQLAANRELAESRGWTIVAEATDNDISALRGKHRPGYEQVLDLVRGVKVDHVVVWQTSRLLRNRKERAEAIELFARQRVGIITVKGQSLDLSNAYGRGMAGILGEFDTMESEVKSERVAAAAADRAKSGRPNGSLGYGWLTEGKGATATFSEHPEQAPVVREVTRRLLSGETLLGVTRDLNARQITPPDLAAWQALPDEDRARRESGGRTAPTSTWGKTSVKKIAMRPANAGLRIHHRGQPTETTFPGVWPPLATREEWERVCALLSAPERRTNGVARPGARKHLLTWGIGACGVCGGYLRRATKGNARYGRMHELYQCSDNGCTGRNLASVDALVRGVVIARLSRDDALDWLMPDDEEAKQQGARASALGERLDEAADLFASGKLDKRQLERITARLRPQIDAAEDARDKAARSLDLAVLRRLAGPKAAERWDALTVAQRRAVLETLGMEVHIDPVKRRGPGFDPETVRIEWKS